MNTVNHTALANFKKNRGKNFLIGFAVLLTTVLMFSVLTVGFGMIDLEFAQINELYPTYHVMYRNVDEKTAEELRKHNDLETCGLRQDPGEFVVPDATALMTCLDKNAREMSNLTLAKGSWPKQGHEIVVAPEMLEALGIEAGIGDTVVLPYQPYEDGGLGYEEEGEFTITGLLDSTPDNEDSLYPVHVSKDFMEELQPEENRVYRVLVRLKDTKYMTSDEIKNRCREIGENFGITEDRISENGAYLRANYIEPAFYSGIVMLLLVVALASVISIYSIYYISLLYKVQEYGKLKALGATKRQIKQIVFREGMLVAAVAVPIGLAAGTLISLAAFRYLNVEQNPNPVLAELAAQLLASHKVILFQPWIYLASAGAAFLTCWLSMLHPMKIAARISPVEAMCYDGSLKTKKKQRKGHLELNIPRLALANLSRNRKRTAITVLALSMTGILYMVVSTALSCANPEATARDEMFDEFQIKVDIRSNDKMHPEQEWEALCQNNPLSPELEEQVLSVPGVKEITKYGFLKAELMDIGDDERLKEAGVVGIPEKYASLLEKSIEKGSCTYQELLDGNKIVVNTLFLQFRPQWGEIGSKVRMKFFNGSQMLEKEFEIAAVANMPQGLSRLSVFVLPQAVVEEFCDYDMVDYWSISAEKENLEETDKQLRALTEEQPYLEIASFEEILESQKTAMGLIGKICYVFLAVLGSVGIMNLINTMVNSIYVRRKELGIMQALGLSRTQMMKMLQIEGLFYTAGTFLLSIGMGSILGYLFYLYARDNGILSIFNFYFPVVQAVILAAVVVFLQILLTVIITGSFRRQSMIDQIRYAE